MERVFWSVLALSPDMRAPGFARQFIADRASASGFERGRVWLELTSATTRTRLSRLALARIKWAPHAKKKNHNTHPHKVAVVPHHDPRAVRVDGQAGQPRAVGGGRVGRHRGRRVGRASQGEAAVGAARHEQLLPDWWGWGGGRFATLRRRKDSGHVRQAAHAGRAVGGDGPEAGGVHYF